MTFRHFHALPQLPASLGPKTAAQSLSVTYASDVGTNTNPQGVRLSDGTSYYDAAKTGQFPATLGQTTSALSTSVVLASDYAVTTTTNYSTIASNQKKGKITGTALTGTYATVLANTFDARYVGLFNTCDQTILVSLDSGSTDAFELEAGESASIDLGALGYKLVSGVNIQSKHGGVVPTAGTIRATVIGG